MTHKNLSSQCLALLATLCIGGVCDQCAHAQIIDLRPKNPFPTRNVGRIKRNTIPLPPAMPKRDSIQSEPEFIEFKNVQNTIDAENLGGAGFAGVFESNINKSALIEFSSTVGIRLKYESSADLKNQNGTETLPTQWQTALKGVGLVNGRDFTEPSQYTGFENTPAGTLIEWAASPPSAIKGVQTRVAVTRNGLHDRAGNYQSELILSWYKF